jgi:hypothetical protein
MLIRIFYSQWGLRDIATITSLILLPILFTFSISFAQIPYLDLMDKNPSMTVIVDNTTLRSENNITEPIPAINLNATNGRGIFVPFLVSAKDNSGNSK